jgi:diguanylate cyclase (GGDEF)-like protein
MLSFAEPETAARQDARMAEMLDNVYVLGLLVQASGAALIGLFCFASYRSSGHRALVYSTAAWMLLALALAVLLSGMFMPRIAPLADSAYLLAEYGFLFFLVLGLRRLSQPALPLARYAWLLAPATMIALTLPWATNYEFQKMFAIQSGFLAAGFILALANVPNALQMPVGMAGLRAVRGSLLVLIFLFVHYVPIFWLVASGRMELPLAYLKITSVAHLVAEFVLGFGGALAVLELTNRNLQTRNRDLRMAGRRLRQLSETDPLTGALNRRALTAILRERAAEQRVCEGSVALLDVDDMKLVNDHGGHDVGDAVLCALADTASSLLRDGDLMVRWGGDEFVVVAHGLSSEEMTMRLQTLSSRLRAMKSLAGAPAEWLGVSFGVAGFNSTAQIESAIKQADAAMYAQKLLRKPKNEPGKPGENPRAYSAE